MQLSAAAVLKVLASPGKYHFKPGIWYGINTPQTFVDAAQAHTLAGRLGLNQSELMGYLTELGLGTMRLTTWKKVIESMGLKILTSCRRPTLARRPTSRSSRSKRSRSSRQRTSAGPRVCWHSLPHTQRL
jgi:hypothetical protein